MKRTYDLGKGTLLTVDKPEHTMYRDTVRDFFPQGQRRALPTLDQRTGREEESTRTAQRRALRLYRVNSRAPIHCQSSCTSWGYLWT